MILAKKDPDESLDQHTQNCLSVLSDFIQRFDYYPIVADRQNLFELLFRAVLFHDFGKAASGFQDYLHGNNDNGHYRHEILSTLFLPELPVSDEDKTFILLAIATHHKDIVNLKEKTGLSGGRHNGFKVFKEKAEQLKLNLTKLEPVFDSLKIQQSKLTNSEYRINNLPAIPDDYNPVYDDINRYRIKAEDGLLSQQEIITGVFMRGILVTCDHLASGGKKKLPPPIPRANQIIIKKDFNLYKFQKQAAKTSGHLS